MLLPSRVQSAAAITSFAAADQRIARRGPGVRGGSRKLGRFGGVGVAEEANEVGAAPSVGAGALETVVVWAA